MKEMGCKYSINAKTIQHIQEDKTFKELYQEEQQQSEGCEVSSPQKIKKKGTRSISPYGK